MRRAPGQACEPEQASDQAKGLGGVDAYTPARLKNNRPCWPAESPRHATVFLLVRGSGKGGGCGRLAQRRGRRAGKVGRRWAERIASDHLIR